MDMGLARPLRSLREAGTLLESLFWAPSRDWLSPPSGTRTPRASAPAEPVPIKTKGP